jgi:predicted DNA-binding transcriptional regulator
MLKEYMMKDGKVYEVLEKGWGGYPVCRLCPGLKEIPEDKLLREVREEVTEVQEEVKPRRGRRKA